MQSSNTYNYQYTNSWHFYGVFLTLSLF